MSRSIVTERLQQHFPSLSKASDQLPTSAFTLATLPESTPVFGVGDACENYLLVTAGTVRVNMLTRGGKHLLLYRVTAGQSCIITTSCLLGHARYPTFAKTETEVEALVLPQADFQQALDHCSEFRSFVFDGLGQRLADVMARLEAINFTSVDSRLAETLLVFDQQAMLQQITHDRLAEEIGTAREVVSRHLKKYEKAGLIQLSRGAISVIDSAGLRVLSEVE